MKNFAAAINAKKTPIVINYNSEYVYIEFFFLANLSTTSFYFRCVESKINSVKSAIEKMGKLTEDIAIALTHAQTITEVDQLVCSICY